ncbi:lipocalin family protein [Variovorax robiniae]|uniref:Outer membrane lipoprotein Blc n=1 Tax=Variovorax robiniae TaxID=1836199 RepID=A0ABU8X0D9_9BURK
MLDALQNRLFVRESVMVARRLNALYLAVLSALLSTALVSGCAFGERGTAQATLPAVDLASYMGEWQQLAHIPNWFQRKCVSDTRASYRLLASGQVEVRNECRTKTGTDSVVGVARPRTGAVVESGRLQPASLEVAFAPEWVRWVPLVWGNYDIVYLSTDRRVAIVTEPSRRYMWVLSRTGKIAQSEWTAVELRLTQLGFQRDQWVRDAE